MIINPYNIENIIRNGTLNKDIEFNEKLDYDKIYKYVLNNYSEILKLEDKNILKKQLIDSLLKDFKILNLENLEQVVDNILDNIFGYGILQKYINNSDITDIRVVRFDRIYIKIKGKWKLIQEQFLNDIELNEYIRYIILKCDSNINFDMPLIVVSDRQYNLRIEAGISPININSSSIVIRIHRNRKLSLINLKTEKMFKEQEYKLLKSIIMSNKNIIIAGKGGSGKTSLLKALLNELVTRNKAITTIEETAELFLEDMNVIQRETDYFRLDSKKITLDKLMHNALVMSNDVIVVGELKGIEITSFLDAIFTGHQGIATIHSNSANSVIDRLVVLLKKDSKNTNYTVDYLKSILVNCIDYIIFLEDFRLKQILDISKNKEKVEFKYLYDILDKD